MTTRAPETRAAPRPGRWYRSLARYGPVAFQIGVVPLVVLGVAATIGVLDPVPDQVRSALRVVSLVAIPVFVAGLVAIYLPRRANTPPQPLRAPVRGRWSALNSPAGKVPSHGIHAFGQTYAIDLIYEPEPGARPAFGGRHPMRAPEDYPAFGQPVVAPADGQVVAVRDGSRDHRARSNLLGFGYLLVEGLVRSALGTTGLMGNHIILALPDGTYVALAHLKRGSARVEPGQHVQAGEVIARVGNSGNSSEPHLHFQLMDHRRPGFAAGLPFAWTDVVVDDSLEPTRRPGEPTVPGNMAVFHAGIEPRRRT